MGFFKKLFKKIKKKAVSIVKKPLKSLGSIADIALKHVPVVGTVYSAGKKAWGAVSGIVGGFKDEVQGAITAPATGGVAGPLPQRKSIPGFNPRAGDLAYPQSPGNQNIMLYVVGGGILLYLLMGRK